VVRAAVEDQQTLLAARLNERLVVSVSGSRLADP